MNEKGLSSKGIFINGKGQIIDMLKYMTKKEREKLLLAIRHRNPQLASELVEQTINFESLFTLSEPHLGILTDYIRPELFGMALKTAPRSFQRKILGIATRSFAEKCYEILTSRMDNETTLVSKAQSKIVQIFVSLLKKQIISLDQ